jgi:hypothetical protein
LDNPDDPIGGLTRKRKNAALEIKKLETIGKRVV